MYTESAVIKEKERRTLHIFNHNSFKLYMWFNITNKNQILKMSDEFYISTFSK